ncbi:hypothetical protein KSD_69070 [Ktedonobacter sp. SOSP1-85]|nr:hypothetical protein KSC_007200 [Ktedonobacter sp. SOSP1-52]GHO79136.1 hypothetical protein KSD_69070 [Ktedonobacter sp. SOSP1-85]
MVDMMFSLLQTFKSSIFFEYTRGEEEIKWSLWQSFVGSDHHEGCGITNTDGQYGITSHAQSG